MMEAEDRTFGDMSLDDALRAGIRPRSPAEALEPERAPRRPHGAGRKRLHPVFAFLNGIMTLLVIALLAAGGLFYFAKIQFDRTGPLDHSEVVVIPKGEGVNAIATRLEREGVISDRRIFVASVIYFKAQNKLQAGEYEFHKFASMRQVLDTLVQGRAVLHRVTIPEGLTSQQVVTVLNEHAMLTGQVEQIPGEGSLLPDTYKFSRGTTRQEILERMQAEQKEFIKGLWGQRSSDLPFSTKREALILASIVEKETSRAEERPRIAAVFINRLKKNMRLQSDPTIIYGIAGGRGALGRPLLRSEIDQPTPYNTYQIRGLPPTPIANPGRAAIEAVLRPARTTDLYFVADGTGGHAFSASLGAHNGNVVKWRAIERERRAKEEEEKRLAAAAAQGEAPLEGENGAPAAGLSLPSDPGASSATLSIPGVTANDSGSSGRGDLATSAVSGPVPLPLRNPRLR